MNYPAKQIIKGGVGNDRLRQIFEKIETLPTLKSCFTSLETLRFISEGNFMSNYQLTYTVEIL